MPAPVRALLLAVAAGLATTHASDEAAVAEQCDAEFKRDFNVSISEGVRRSMGSWAQPNSLSFQDLKVGQCLMTLSIVDHELYIHSKSRGHRKGDGKVDIPNTAFVHSLLDSLKETERELGVRVPDVEFNIMPLDKPQCRTSTAAGLWHHSYCHPTICNGVVPMMMSYNQHISEMRKSAPSDAAAAKIPWSKKIGRAVWRGARSGHINDLAIYGWANKKETPRQFVVNRLGKKKANKGVLDAKFGRMPWNQLMKHKYVVAVAGNTYSSLFKHAMRSGGCVLRQEERIYEWFEPFLTPWVHYVPVRWDLSDLLARIRWAQTHDADAERIAANAAKAGDALFSPHSMACYAFVAARTYRAAMAWDPPASANNGTAVPLTTLCHKGGTRCKARSPAGRGAASFPVFPRALD